MLSPRPIDCIVWGHPTIDRERGRLLDMDEYILKFVKKYGKMNSLNIIFLMKFHVELINISCEMVY